MWAHISLWKGLWNPWEFPEHALRITSLSLSDLLMGLTSWLRIHTRSCEGNDPGPLLLVRRVGEAAANQWDQKQSSRYHLPSKVTRSMRAGLDSILFTVPSTDRRTSDRHSINMCWENESNKCMVTGQRRNLQWWVVWRKCSKRKSQGPRPEEAACLKSDQAGQTVSQLSHRLAFSCSSP